MATIMIFNKKTWDTGGVMRVKSNEGHIAR